MHRWRKCPAPTELPHAGPGDAPKSTSPGLGAGGNAFFCGVSRSQGVKIHEDLLKMCGFQCIGGGSVPAPLSYRTLGRAMRQKTHPWPWRRGQCNFFVSYHVGKMLKSVKVCLKCPVFNALGAVVCRLQSVAGRWAGWRAKRRVAWPWRRLECIFLSCFWFAACGKTRCMGNIAVAMQCSGSHLVTLRTAPVKIP